MTARPSATVVGAPCVKCKQAPCACLVEFVDRNAIERTPLRRHRFPNGLLFRLDEHGGARALAAGAVLDGDDRTPS